MLKPWALAQGGRNGNPRNSRTIGEGLSAADAFAGIMIVVRIQSGVSRQPEN